MTRAREGLALLLACAALYLTGIGDVPFYTRGEPREGLVVRELVRRGDWLVPMRPGGEPARKPPLYYWLAGATFRLLPGRPEMALRLPSAVLATAAVLGTWATVRAAFGPLAGFPAALVLATAFEWTRAATSARVDMTLAAALTAVLVGWTLVLSSAWRGGLVLAAAGAALGTLAKGPVALLLPALTAGLLFAVPRTRPIARRLHPGRVLGAAAVVAGAWYAVALARQGGVLVEVVARENWQRFLAAEEHAHGVGYLLGLGLAGLLPWTPLVPLALVALRRPAPAPAVLLAAAWIVTGAAFFALASAKRSVYLLPLYPALALLLGAGVAAPPESGRLRTAARIGAAAYVPAALVLAALAGAFAWGFDPGALVRPYLRPADAAASATLAAAARTAAPLLGALALGTAAAAAVVLAAVRGARWRLLVGVIGAVAVAWTACFGAVLHPAIARARSLRGFFARVAALVPADVPLYAFFPADPGARFYTPRPLRPWPDTGVPAGALLLLWEADWRRLRDAAGRPLTVLAVSEGRQPRRGHLALVAAPGGALVPAVDPPGPPSAPGLRTGSRPP